MDDFENKAPNEEEKQESEFSELEQSEEITETVPKTEQSAEEMPSKNDFSAEEASLENGGESDKTEITPTPVSAERFDYSPVSPAPKGKSGKGIKVFSLILAAVILITGACSIGYFYGKKNIFAAENSHTEAELAQRPADTDEMTDAQVYEKVNKSVVGIRIYNSSGAYVDASGVVYSKEGYIVSNDHIYAEFGAPKFKVYTYDGKEYPATFIAGDQVADLCILKVDGAKLIPAEFGDSTKLFCGEHVVTVGRPSDATDESSITKGVVSLPRRRVKNDSNYASSYIQTDAAINPGSSGGALSNMYGQVIGITTSKLSGLQYDSVGFALPSAMMKRIAEDMIENGKVTKRAKLGITYTEITSVYVETGNYSNVGLLIASVTNDSDLYGKVKEGDIITHVNGKEITGDDVILDVIEDSTAGDTITITVISENGKTKEYKVKLLANTGTSSYNPNEIVLPEKGDDDTEENANEQGDMPGGTFDFPFGNW